jgi:hypothetical protein
MHTSLNTPVASYVWRKKQILLDHSEQDIIIHHPGEGFENEKEVNDLMGQFLIS